MATKKKKRIFQTLGTIVTSAAAGGGITAGLTLNIGNESNTHNYSGVETKDFVNTIDRLYGDILKAKEQCLNNNGTLKIDLIKLIKEVEGET